MAISIFRSPAAAALFILSVLAPESVTGQIKIPARYDGFVYGARPATMGSVLIEAFLDPVCPDSRDSWGPLKKAVKFHGPTVSLIVHPFALPYHDNAFVTSRALHIVNRLNASMTYKLLDSFFKHQEQFYNKLTLNMSRASVVDRVAEFSAKAVGDRSLYSAIKLGFSDRDTDLTTRVSFKYGCTRGVYGTPFFFVNGFALPDGGSPIDYNGWRKIIDPLNGTLLLTGHFSHGV